MQKSEGWIHHRINMLRVIKNIILKKNCGVLELWYVCECTCIYSSFPMMSLQTLKIIAAADWECGCKMHHDDIDIHYFLLSSLSVYLVSTLYYMSTNCRNLTAKASHVIQKISFFIAAQTTWRKKTVLMKSLMTLLKLPCCVNLIITTY